MSCLFGFLEVWRRGLYLQGQFKGTDALSVFERGSLGRDQRIAYFWKFFKEGLVPKGNNPHRLKIAVSLEICLDKHFMQSLRLHS